MDPALINRIKGLYRIQKKIDLLNNERNVLREEIEYYLYKHHLENQKFKIGDKQLIYEEVVSTQSLSQKYIKETLREYFRNDPSLADHVYEYLLNHREKIRKYQLKMTKIKKK